MPLQCVIYIINRVRMCACSGKPKAGEAGLGRSDYGNEEEGVDMDSLGAHAGSGGVKYRHMVRLDADELGTK